MKEFEASRLSEGNQLMPTKIKIDDFGVTLIMPSVFGSKEETASFHNISTINIENPLIGFSTITIDTKGSVYMRATGFSSSDANEIKRLIQIQLSAIHNNTNTNNQQTESIKTEYKAPQEAINDVQTKNDKANLYEDQLEKLIDLALADGVLTDKEKQVLFKKAEALNVDLDEFEMVLDAKLHEKQKSNTIQNKEFVKEVKKENINITKCPRCNDVIPALSRICPSCNFSINSSDQEKGDSLETLIKNVENDIVLLKTYHKSTFLNTFKKQIGVVLLFIGVLLFAFSIIKLGHVDFGILFFILSIIIVISGILTLVYYKPNKVIKKQENDNHDFSFDGLNAEIEKQLRVVNNLYSGDAKVKGWLTEFQNEVSKIAESHKKKKNHFFIIYGSLLGISLLALCIPVAKSEYEIEADNKKVDSELMLKAEDFIKNKNFESAKSILVQLKSSDDIVIIKSKIQLEELNAKLNVIEPLVKKHEYQQIKLELDKIVWEKISTESSTIDVERDIYKIFLEKKEAINNQLPKKYKVEIGSEYSL